MELNLTQLRKEYLLRSLSKNDLLKNPYDQFAIWFKEALNTQVLEPNAMTLSTASKQGKPSSRMVLLKNVNEKGFIFYTDLGSRKAQELKENPFASLTFFWKNLERQVIIEGTVERVSDQEAKNYFSSRSRESQIAASASHQGAVLSSRKILEECYKEIESKFTGQEIPLPTHWGGFIVLPSRFEFWQGRIHRLHDRFHYRFSTNQEWIIERLSP